MYFLQTEWLKSNTFPPGDEAHHVQIKLFFSCTLKCSTGRAGIIIIGDGFHRRARYSIPHERLGVYVHACAAEWGGGGGGRLGARWSICGAVFLADRRGEAGRLNKSVVHSHPEQHHGASPASHHTGLTARPPSAGWNPSVYPAKNRLHTLRWRGFSWQDPLHPSPSPSSSSLIQTGVPCRYWYAALGPAACQPSSNHVFGRRGGKKCPREEEMAGIDELTTWVSGGWMDRHDSERGEGWEEVQLKEGAAINTMTHCFWGGHFLTAFIKANLIILAW